MTKRISIKKRRPATEQEVAVIGEYITLGQLLKVADVIGSGGEAKLYLAETAVQVNGEPEQRRGRKLRPGDTVVAPGAPPIRLIASEPEDIVSPPASLETQRAQRKTGEESTKDAKAHEEKPDTSR